MRYIPYMGFDNQECLKSHGLGVKVSLLAVSELNFKTLDSGPGQ